MRPLHRASRGPPPPLRGYAPRRGGQRVLLRVRCTAEVRWRAILPCGARSAERGRGTTRASPASEWWWRGRDLIQGAHARPEPLIITARTRVHGRQRIPVLVRRPQAIEADEVAIAPVHAGDAVIFVPTRAIESGNLVRHGLVLARPWNDAARVVAAVDLRLRGYSRRAQHENQDRHYCAHQPCSRTQRAQP